MKTLLLLMMVLVTNLCFSENGESIKDIEQSHKTPPIFKYHYDAGNNLTFTILAYWENNKGVVYSFSRNGLAEKREFNDYKNFADFLVPPGKEFNQYVIIPLKK